MKDGDIFRWSYRQEVVERRKDDVRAGTLYWCCANIAIFKNDILRDIFWSTGDGRSWTPEQAEKELELQFLANEEDIEPAKMPEYYDSRDVVDLSHSNRMGNGLFTRKGARRSKEAMRALINYKTKEAEYEIRSAQRTLELMKNKLVEIDHVEDLEKFYV
jgi:hypothetical protein